MEIQMLWLCVVLLAVLWITQFWVSIKLYVDLEAMKRATHTVSYINNSAEYEALTEKLNEKFAQTGFEDNII